MKYYVDAFKKYSDIKGCTTRKEYWMFMLVNIIIFFVFQIIGMKVGFPVLGYLYVIVSVIPVAAASARRLIDAGRSKYWLFTVLVPPVGIPIVLYLLLSKSVNRKEKRKI